MANDRGRNRRDRTVLTAEETRDDARVVTEERPGVTGPYDERPVVRRPRQPQGGGNSWLWAILGIIGAIIIGLILWSLFADDDEIPDTGASIEEITDNPARYYGDVVTVGGEVENIVGRRAFTIGGDDFIGGDELLVVSASGLPAVANRAGAPELAEDDLVTVTGPVRRFVLADIERELGADLDDNLFRDWEGQPAVVARNIDLSPRSAGFARGGVGATIDDITDEPERWYGQRVTVSGEINDVLGARAFTIGGEGFFDGDELLVVGARQMLAMQGRPANQPFSEDDIVQVTGPVRRFVLRDIEREIGFDLDDNLFADWEGRPAVVARNINLTPFSAPPTNGAAQMAIGSLLANPDPFFGRPVTVEAARVTRIVGPNAFVLNDRLLVTGRNVPGGLEVGDRVQVSGPFNHFNLQNVERELGMDLDDQRFNEFRDRPAIIANNIVME